MLRSLKIRGCTFEWGTRTYVMGILNVTPDSFSDGGQFYRKDTALKQAERLIREGADLLDIGGESTRPFAEPVPEDEELRRVIPVIEAIRREFPEIPLSVDTYKARVAEEALRAGADIVNDVSALRFDVRMSEVIRRYNTPVILMHMKGTPQTMQIDPHYEDVIAEIKDFLQERAKLAISLGLSPEKIIVDPGIGFGKRFEDNLKIIKEISDLKELGYPVLLGPSRKSFLGEILGKEARLRDAGTGAIVAYGVLHRVDILRVHNVEWCKDIVKVIETLMKVC